MDIIENIISIILYSTLGITFFIYLAFLGVFGDVDALESCEYDFDNNILLCKYKRGYTKRYKGSGTVWYNYDNGVRCSTSMEITLQVYYNRCKKENKHE